MADRTIQKELVIQKCEREREKERLTKTEQSCFRQLGPNPPNYGLHFGCQIEFLKIMFYIFHQRQAVRISFIGNGDNAFLPILNYVQQRDLN